MNIKEERKQNVINNINKTVRETIVKYGWNKAVIDCPNDLFEEIREHFKDKELKIWRKGYEVCNIDGWGSGEYEYNYYVALA